MSDNSTKVLEDFLNEIFMIIRDISKELFKAIVILFKSAGIGFKKSWKNKKLFIGLIPSFLIPIVARVNVDFFLVDRKFYFKIIYFLLWFSPVYYFALVSCFKSKSEKENDKFKEAFEDLGFKGSDSKLPILKSHTQDKETKIDERVFESKIPIEVWRHNIPQIQAAVNISIISIKQGKSKQIVIMKSMSGSLEIEEKIPWSDEYIEPQEGVVCIGESETQKIKIDLNKSPHLLSAGETGSGKSVIVRCILWQLISQGAIAYMVDFKGGVEFGLQYEKIGQVITEVDEAEALFAFLVEENSRRLKLLRENQVKNIAEYNAKCSGSLRRIVVVIDELAELMDKTGVDEEKKEKLTKIEGYLSTLARLSRATGINLLIATQRPDAKVITGQIKNNVPVRICGRFADAKASEIVLSNTKAKDLDPIKGRFLFKLGADTIEFQA
ncbi:FtsK/SpoIIIE domain-containing protein, partial [Clostridium perfringens]